ncbi:MAG: nucleotide exchange factor GrpE [Deltaproteobacteria bacterium]|nr:nucleotide exchange factor GrpE [Deltaproteobacteria bacterium]
MKSKGFTVQDDRFWLREDGDEPGQAAPRPPSYIAELEQRLEEKDRQLLDTIAAHKSSVADLQQVRERLERDLEQRLDIEKARLVEPLLEVLDNLERLGQREPVDAAGLVEGAQLVLAQMREKLGGLGVVEIEAEGQVFDPRRMEAMATAEVDPFRDGEVVAVIRKGYTLGDRIIRPAGVQVGVAERS